MENRINRNEFENKKNELISKGYETLQQEVYKGKMFYELVKNEKKLGVFGNENYEFGGEGHDNVGFL